MFVVVPICLANMAYTAYVLYVYMLNKILNTNLVPT